MPNILEALIAMAPAELVAMVVDKAVADWGQPAGVTPCKDEGGSTVALQDLTSFLMGFLMALYYITPALDRYPSHWDRIPCNQMLQTLSH